MEKRLVWYQLFLKQNIRKQTTWMMLSLMLVLLWIVPYIAELFTTIMQLFEL